MADSPFTIDPRVGRLDDVVSDVTSATTDPVRPQRNVGAILRSVLEWCAVAAVGLLAAAWCWLFSIPGGAHLLVGVPLVGLFTLVGCVVLCVVGSFSARAALGRSPRIPAAALVTGVVLVTLVVGTHQDAWVRIRFELNRTEFDRQVRNIGTVRSIDSTDSLFVQADISGFGDVGVRNVPGGIFVMTPTPGEGQQPGFAYLPSPRSVDEWDATLRLRPLGDHWYLAT